MKREFRCLSVILMMVSIIGFVSCSSDDDSIGGGSASTTAGVLDGLNKRVKSVDDCTFYYKDNGLLDYITNRYEPRRCEFTYNPNKIIIDGDEEDNWDIVITYNGAGYIARVDVTGTYTNIDEDGKTCGTSQETRFYAYNNSGYLTSIKGSLKGSEDDFTSKATYSVLLTWENNLLLSAACEENWQETEDGKSSHFHDVYTISFSYDNDYYNKYHQYTPSVLHFLSGIEGSFEDMPLRTLAYVGLMGKGPLYLPVSSVTTEQSEHHYEEGEDYNYSDTYTRNYSYGFNNDGSISYTSIGGLRYNFGYEHLNSANRAPVATSSDSSMGFRRSSSPVRKRKSRLLKRVNN